MCTIQRETFTFAGKEVTVEKNNYISIKNRRRTITVRNYIRCFIGATIRCNFGN